jgi:hypothetical protein
MQLSEIRTRVRYHLREATANVWADAELTAHINLAQRHIASRLNPEYLTQLIQTADNVYSGSNANLPTEFLKMAGSPYNATTGDVYDFLSLAEAIPWISQSATPSNVGLFTLKRISWIQNQDLYVNPSLAGTLTVPYVKYPADLSADGDSSTIEDSVIDLVIMKAAADALLKTRQAQELSILVKQIETKIEQLNRSK